MLLTIALIPALEQLAPRLRLVDVPGGRKQHARLTPRVGGLAMAAGFFAAAWIALPVDRTVVSVLSSLLLLVVFGTWDDRIDINYRLKFLGQFIAATIAVFGGDLYFNEVQLPGSSYVPETVWKLVSVLFLVGVTNAVNLTDGLDGLAGGLCLLILGATAALGLSSGEGAAASAATLLALAAIGSLLGFLRFNSHPARVFMGDAGSQFLGFAAAALAIYVTQSESLAVSGMLPLLIIGLPIYDTLSVMARRLLSGRSPFRPDRLHVHYRLTELGISHPAAVMIVYAMQAALIALAYLLRYSSDTSIVAAFLSFAAFTELVLLAAERGHGRRSLAALGRAVGAVSSTASRGAAFSVVRALAAMYLGILVFAAGFLAQRQGADVAALAACAALGLLLVPLTDRRDLSVWAARLFLYTTVAVTVYMLYTMAAADNTDQKHLLPLLPLVPLVLAGFLFADGASLRLSPLDFLLLFFLFALPNLPGVPVLTNLQKQALLCLLFCYYAVEMAISARGFHSFVMRTLMIGGLVVTLTKTLLS